MLVLNGYPPKLLSLHNAAASLDELGIRSGDTLIVEQQQPSQSSGTVILDSSHDDSSHNEKMLVPKITRRYVGGPCCMCDQICQNPPLTQCQRTVLIVNGQLHQ